VLREVTTEHVTTGVGVEDSTTLGETTPAEAAGWQETSDELKGAPFWVRDRAQDTSVTLDEAVAESVKLG
jgi:hypothetical protein